MIFLLVFIHCVGFDHDNKNRLRNDDITKLNNLDNHFKHLKKDLIIEIKRIIYVLYFLSYFFPIFDEEGDKSTSSESIILISEMNFL